MRFWCDVLCYWRCGLASSRGQHIVRRSVALPVSLVDQALAAAPEVEGNFHRLVASALRRLIAARQSEEFAKAMASMADDPEIQAECDAIASDFAASASDGLEQEP